MLVLRALEATVSKDAPVTPLQGKTVLHRGHFVLLSYLSLSCFYLNMVKCLIGGEGVFWLFLFIFVLCSTGSTIQASISYRKQISGGS